MKENFKFLEERFSQGPALAAPKEKVERYGAEDEVFTVDLDGGVYPKFPESAHGC